MSLVAFADVVNAGVMRSRFHAEPIVRATELLLQERTPRDVLVARPRAEEVSASAKVRELIPPVVRRFSTPHDATPRTQLLSNGRYAVMLTAAGSGYSRWRDIAVTRWREDPTRDCWGQYIYLRDEQTGSVWSAGYQPAGVEPDAYEAVFFEDHAEIVRRDRSLTTTLEVVVSSEDDAEVRRVSLTNLGVRARDIQVTSYAELSLTTQAADVAHPAFANLFVETEYEPDVGALLATRRKRSDDEASVWAAHVLVVDGETVGDLQYETDRARFVGRARDLRNPVSVMDGRPLSGTVGSVLDPIVSLRRTVRVPRGQHGSSDFFHGCGRHARRSARSRRQISRSQNLRSHSDARLDASASSAASPRDQFRRSAAVSAPGQRRPVRGFLAAPRRRCSGAHAAGHLDAVGSGHFRRSARSFWRALTIRTTSKSSASCCARTNTGA